MDWKTLSRAKRRFLRRHPRPEQPPEGHTTWDHPDRPGEVLYIEESSVRELMQANIDGYDDLPKDLRDYVKEHGQLP